MPKAQTSSKTYAELSDELSQIIEWFESDNVDLDEAIVKYEAAVKLIAAMQDYLKNAQNTISKITAKLPK